MRPDARDKTINGAFNVTNTSLVVRPVNAWRTGLVLTNDSGVVIYIALGANAVINSGMRLNATGGAYEITADNPYHGPISAIAGVAGPSNLCFIEKETAAERPQE